MLSGEASCTTLICAFLLYCKQLLPPLAFLEAFVTFLPPLALAVEFTTLDSSAVAATVFEALVSGAAVSARSLRACFDIEASLEATGAPAGESVLAAFFVDVNCFFAGVDVIVVGDRCCRSAIVIFWPISDCSAASTA